jgi:DNA-binding NtrC family response regulator
MRILIVEDESVIALEYELTVLELGYTVVGVAEDTVRALDLASQTKPHVALIDMRLKDGPTGNAIALALHQNHGIKPIFITGNIAMVTPEAKALCLGLLPKPVSPASLEALLHVAARITEGTIT